MIEGLEKLARDVYGAGVNHDLELLKLALALLTPREQQVLNLHYGIGCEPEHATIIATQIPNLTTKTLGITRERVYQIERMAFRRLRVRLKYHQMGWQSLEGATK